MELVLVAVVLADLFVLASPPLAACIRAVALQGMALGLIPLLLHRDGWSAHTFLIAFGMIALKGFLIPGMLFKALREAPLHREEEPLVGFSLSLILGGGLIALAVALAGKLPLPVGVKGSLLVPAALATVMMGCLVIVTRVKAMSQVLGFLMLENGILAFGLTLSRELPVLVETGVLMDVFVGVFIMAVVIRHIQLEFGSMNTRKLTALKE